MDSYYGKKIGKLKIPVYVFAQNHDGFRFDDVQIRWERKEYELPLELQSIKAQTIEEKEKEAKKNNIEFYNGSLVRLNDLDVHNKTKLELITTPVDYHSHEMTNHSLDYVMKDGGTVREKYSDPFTLNDSLANPLTVSNTVISESENKLIFSQRSSMVKGYHGYYQSLGVGLMDADADIVNESPNPCMTAKRETKEEAGIDMSLDDFFLFSVGRDANDLHVAISGMSRTSMKINEIHDAPKEEGFEAERILDVDFNPESVIPFFRGYHQDGRDGPRWLPSSALGTIYALIKEYGGDRVKRSIDNL